MNKKQRFLAAVRGEEVDYVPSVAWCGAQLFASPLRFDDISIMATKANHPFASTRRQRPASPASTVKRKPR